MKAIGGRRTMPNAREVREVLSRLGSPKTIAQLSAESGMHPMRVTPAVRSLCARHLVIEADSDPVRFVRVR